MSGADHRGATTTLRASGCPARPTLGIVERHDYWTCSVSNPKGEVMTSTPGRGLNSTVTRFWSLAAPAYNLPFLQQWVYRPAHDEVIEHLRAHRSRRVADIGCGPGILAARIERERHPEKM